MFTIPQNQYFYSRFRTFKGTLKMLQITFCPQTHQEESLKWPKNLNPMGYAARIFVIFYSQSDYQMVNI